MLAQGPCRKPLSSMGSLFTKAWSGLYHSPRLACLSTPLLLPPPLLPRPTASLNKYPSSPTSSITAQTHSISHQENCHCPVGTHLQGHALALLTSGDLTSSTSPGWITGLALPGEASLPPGAPVSDTPPWQAGLPPGFPDTPCVWFGTFTMVGQCCGFEGLAWQLCTP